MVGTVADLHFTPTEQARENLLREGKNVKIVEPFDVLDFHNIMAKSSVILTDSGGIQEEVSSFGKPVLVLRDTTERPEGVEAGVLKLVGTNRENIYSAFEELLENENTYKSMTSRSNVYGDGLASRRIVDIIIYYFSKLER